MANKRIGTKTVVRIALTEAEADRFGMLIEWLRYSGHVVVHQNDDLVSTMLIDLLPPKGVDEVSWAKQNAERIASFGTNAVAAPRWETVSPVQDDTDGEYCSCCGKFTHNTLTCEHCDRYPG